MRSEWTRTRLSDVVDVLHGFAFKGEFFSDSAPGDVLVTPRNFAIGGGFRSDKLKFYRGSVDDRYVLREGEVVVVMTDLSRSGDILGYSAFVPRAKRWRFLHNQRIGLVQPRRGADVDLRFIAYLMRTTAYRSHVLAGASGSTVKHTSPSRLGEFVFRLPPRGEQSAIADVLWSLEAKIESNRRLASVLHRLANAIYEAQFVDFVGATELVDENREVIPPGWEISTLGAIAQRLSKTVNPAHDPTQGFEHFSIPTFDAGEMPEQVPGGSILSAKTSLTEPAILLSKLNPRIRRVWDARPSSRRAVCSSEFIALVPRDGVPHSYVQSVVRFDAAFWDHVLARTSGTTGSRQRVRPDDVLDAPLVLPPADVLAAFDQFGGPLFDRLYCLQLQTRQLSRLRGELLDPLVTGELRIPSEPLGSEVSGSGEAR